jgi:hypothetical protein
MIEAKFNASGWDAAFAKIKGSRESLARRMGVSGGVLLRDEAKAIAPIAEPAMAGDHPPGTYRDSIYLAFDSDRSTATEFAYKVSWNAQIAWWGKLIEFGHWMPYKVVRVNGSFYTTDEKDERNGGKGQRIPAQGILARTGDALAADALRAMIERGKAELPILLGGGT